MGDKFLSECILFSFGFLYLITSMKTGTVKFFDETKGYGFIVMDENQQEIFVHVSGLAAPIKQHDKVSFEIRDGKKGPNAFNVEKI